MLQKYHRNGQAVLGPTGINGSNRTHQLYMKLVHVEEMLGICYKFLPVCVVVLPWSGGRGCGQAWPSGPRGTNPPPLDAGSSSHTPLLEKRERKYI